MTDGHRASGIGHRPKGSGTAPGPVVPNSEARSPKPVRLGILVSGGGTNLQAILDACGRGDIRGNVVVVVSSRPDAYAVDRARQAGVPAVVLAPRSFPDRDAYDAKLAEVLRAYSADLICLAGFLRILTPEFVAQFAGRIMNIHPALLPAFGGVGMYGAHVHNAVLASGVKISGCTVHFVDETPDGGPIILQAAVPVHDGDTDETLAARVAAEEHRLYPEAIKLFADGRLRVVGKRVTIIEEREREAALLGVIASGAKQSPP